MSSVSVVMSAYNAEKFIAKSIESILDQSMRDFEFIIINDGSSDKTSDIIDFYAARDSRIKTVHHPNKGLTKSLNEGILIYANKSKYIARMDADDISHPDRIKLEYNFLESNPEYILVGTDYSEIDVNGNIIKKVRRPYNDDCIRLLMYVNSPLAHGSVMYNREAFKRLGGYRESSGSAEDYDLWVRLSSLGKAHIIPRVLFSWRISDYNITTVKSKKVSDDAAIIRRNLNKSNPIIISRKDIVNKLRHHSKERSHYVYDTYGRIVVFQLKYQFFYGMSNLIKLLFLCGKIGRKILLNRFIQIITAGKKSLYE